MAADGICMRTLPENLGYLFDGPLERDPSAIAVFQDERQLSYEELAFHLLDSASFQAFARLPLEFIPKKSALQLNIGSLKAGTWDTSTSRGTGRRTSM